jgi:hypothetical protein
MPPSGRAFSEAARVLERVGLIASDGAEHAPFFAAYGEELDFGGGVGAETPSGRVGDQRNGLQWRWHDTGSASDGHSTQDKHR